MLSAKVSSAPGLQRPGVAAAPSQHQRPHHRCSFGSQHRRQQHVLCRVAQPEEDNIPTAASPVPAAASSSLKDLQQGWNSFMQRYEHSMLSSGVGAAAVTTWCVLHGQDAGTAAGITVTSIVTAMVLNELLFPDSQ